MYMQMPEHVSRGVYSILAMKQLASFANSKLEAKLKNDAVFYSWGNIMLGFYNDMGLCSMYILCLFIFFLLAEV